MYDPHTVQHALYTQREDHTEPPIEAYEPRQTYTPVEPPRTAQYPSQYYPAVQQPQQQSPYAAQDRQTIQSMMREISLMQRRLDIMMSSCQAMIERTQIMHEYHHIARYEQRRQHMPPMQHNAPQYYSEAQFTPSHMQRPIMQEPPAYAAPTPQPALSTKEGVFDGTHMISADGDIYTVPKAFLCKESLIEGDIMQAQVFPSGEISFAVSEPTAREHIMGILSTHAANSPHYIVQTANKAYKVLTEAVEASGAAPGNQVLLTVPAGGESEWAAIEKVFAQ